MASSVSFSNRILGQFLDTLERVPNLQNLVWRDVETDFTGRVGRTVDLRKPQVRSAQSADVGPQNHQGDVGVGGPFDATAFPTLTSVEGNDSYIPITINERIYDRQPISDYSETMDIENYTIQIVAPMVRAVSRGLEDEIAALMAGATYPAASTWTINRGTGTGYTVDAGAPGGEGNEDFVNVIADFKTRLDSVDVPQDGRVLLVGNDYQNALLQAESVKNSDKAGTAEQLRTGMIMNHYGFDIMYSNAIASNKAYAFHRSSYFMAVRAPRVPQGVIDAAVMADSNFAMTMVVDYNQSTSATEILVSSFVGTAVNLDPGLQDAAATNPAGAPTFLRAIDITVLDTAVNA